MRTVPAPASADEALAMLRAGMSYLAAADPTAMAAQTQAECLQTLEQLDAVETAARAGILAACTAGRGYSADADYSPTSLIIHRTKVTKGAARGHLGWARRSVTHPRVVLALAEGTVLSESMARTICGWTDKLPPMTSGSPRPGPARARRTWPAWPPRSTPGPCPRTTTTRSRPSRTGRSGWRPRSAGRASSPGT